MRRAARLARSRSRQRATARASAELLCTQLLLQHSPVHSRVTVRQTRPSAKTQVPLDMFTQREFGQTTLNRGYSRGVGNSFWTAYK